MLFITDGQFSLWYIFTEIIKLDYLFLNNNISICCIPSFVPKNVIAGDP